MLDHDEFFSGYLDAILFTESVGGEDEEHHDDTSLLSHGCDRDDFTDEARAALRVDCEDFIGGNAADLEAYCDLQGDWDNPNGDSFGRTHYSASERAGSHFWLSRNGHGAGFFDRGSEPVFRRLQDAARIYNSAYVYFDGDRIHAN